MRLREAVFFVGVSAGAPEAVYEPTARQLRGRISSEDLPPGTAPPSVRTLASDLGYDFNTPARGFRLLEEDGFVRVRNRAGTDW